MEEVIVEEPQSHRKELEEVEGIHDLFFEYLHEIRHREIHQIAVEVLGLGVEV